jgi:hypothetical protein
MDLIWKQFCNYCGDRYYKQKCEKCSIDHKNNYCCNCRASSDTEFCSICIEIYEQKRIDEPFCTNCGIRRNEENKSEKNPTTICDNCSYETCNYCCRCRETLDEDTIYALCEKCNIALRNNN